MLLQCPVSQDLALQGVSLLSVCWMWSAIVFWLLFSLVQSSAEVLFACCGQCLFPAGVGLF